MQVFLQLAIQEVIDSKELLYKTDIICDESRLYCFQCEGQVESASHIVVKCKWAWKVWANIFSWDQMFLACPATIEILLSLNGVQSNK